MLATQEGKVNLQTSWQETQTPWKNTQKQAKNPNNQYPKCQDKACEQIQTKTNIQKPTNIEM